MKISKVYEEGLMKLLQGDVPDARLDAGYILEFVTGKSRMDMILNPDTQIDNSAYNQYMRCIEKRACRYPLQYITGIQNFMGFDFMVNESVLIPRQDTEVLVEQIIKISRGSNILDMCTGSGCIAVSIAALGAPHRVVAADISESAINIAAANAEKILDDGIAVEFIKSDLFESIAVPGTDEDKFDIIVSNPPYIPEDVIGTLMPEVRCYEPLIALKASGRGLEFYEIISEKSRDYIKPGGHIFYEIGCEQAADVTGILEKNSYADIKIIKDYAGLDRVVSAVYGGQED